MESIELLKHNLAIEYDLQNFIALVLQSVQRLGGSSFNASLGALDLMRKLRQSGAASGLPLQVSLNLDKRQLMATWENHQSKIIDLVQTPCQENIDELKLHLHNSTAALDPDILLQRNIQMSRHLEETRANTEKELEALQKTLRMRQAQLQKSIQQAETDPLTGLFNRRAFDEKVEQYFRRTMRQKDSPLSLLLFDLDHFKQINDAFGHQFGDAYLNKLAHVLRNVSRQDVDFAFRFGGDEFAMLMFADYRIACEKSKQVLETMDCKVSIGVSTINIETPDDLSLEEFIHRADNALYRAKNQGRGRVVIDICTCHDCKICVLECPAHA